MNEELNNIKDRMLENISLIRKGIDMLEDKELSNKLDYTEEQTHKANTTEEIGEALDMMTNIILETREYIREV